MHLEVGLLLQHLDRNEGLSIFSREPDLRPTVVPRPPDRLDDVAERLCQVNIARTGFASDEIATRTLDLDTRRLTPDPEGTFA